SSSCGAVRIGRPDLWLGRPEGATSDCADEVTLSLKGANSPTRGRKLRSTGTKARARVSNEPNSVIGLKKQLEARTRELAEARGHLSEALERQACPDVGAKLLRRDARARRFGVLGNSLTDGAHHPPHTQRDGVLIPMLTLAQAAAQTGMARSSILRAIKRGALSGTRNPDGTWLVDPAQLARAFPVNAQPALQAAHPHPVAAVRPEAAQQRIAD